MTNRPSGRRHKEASHGSRRGWDVLEPAGELKTSLGLPQGGFDLGREVHGLARDDRPKRPGWAIVTPFVLCRRMVRWKTGVTEFL